MHYVHIILCFVSFHQILLRMPLGDWLKSWTGDLPPEKPENVVVAESLLMELDYQMKEAAERMKLQEQENKRRMSGGVDYSWLVIAKDKQYEMPQLERLELEDICMKIKPDECGRVIIMFRDALVRDPDVQEIPRILRAVLHQVLDGRPKEESMPEWVMKSITSLSKYRPNPRISPIDASEDSEGRVSRKRSSTSSSMSFIEEPRSEVMSDTIDELPV